MTFGESCRDLALLTWCGGDGIKAEKPTRIERTRRTRQQWQDGESRNETSWQDHLGSAIL